jgi:dTDP-glucose 4,6-dehydratase
MSEKIKYLVTGGAGFIGSNFVRFLYRQHKNIEVCVLDKLGYSASLENLKDYVGRKDFSFIKGDICDPRVVEKAMTGAHVVVNFAAEVAVDRSIDDPQSFLKTDIFGVYTLLEEARRQTQLKKFIQISTDEVYGQILKGSFKESSELITCRS